MRRDCHYAAVALIAKRAKRPDYPCIAWAGFQVDCCKGMGFHTQVNPLNFIYSWAGVYFHFLPGENESNKLITTAASKCVMKVMEEAIYSGNAIRIGMAAHAFLDSYSHEDFMGRINKYNSAPLWQEGWKAVIPDFGHSDFLTNPDETHLQWFDSRQQKMVDNQAKFTVALDKLATILGVPIDEREDFLVVVKNPSYDRRKAAWLDMAGVKPFSVIQKEMWDLHKSDFKRAAKQQIEIVRSFL